VARFYLVELAGLLMFRFTLRDLFWLTLLVATALGWSASYARYERRLFDRGRHAEALRRELAWQ
jgi:hypothetical protein